MLPGYTQEVLRLLWTPIALFADSIPNVEVLDRIFFRAVEVMVGIKVYLGYNKTYKSHVPSKKDPSLPTYV